MTAFDEQVRGHEFDGIEEYDNRLPNWWLWSFYGACIFSFLYWFHFHVLGTGALPTERYQMEMEAAEARLAEQMAGVEITDDLLEKLAGEPTFVEKGRAVFLANCVQCHLESGGGSIGPNLTDGYWLHGGNPTDMYTTVTKGVIEKGMVAWLPQLGLTKCQQVTAYVMTLRNTNVVGGKEPQGEKVESP